MTTPTNGPAVMILSLLLLMMLVSSAAFSETKNTRRVWCLPGVSFHHPRNTRRRAGNLSRLNLYLRDLHPADPYDGRPNATMPSPHTTTATAPVVTAGGGIGDIMSPTVDDADRLFRDGLVTSETYSLAHRYGITHPLDRMAVTANGNLQRLFSSYYDAPVTVVVDHCARQPGSDDKWNRRVFLQVLGKTFCVAESTVQVHSADCLKLVESGEVGLGQLFRHLNLLPEFVLEAAGPTTFAVHPQLQHHQSSSQQGFWRNYTLDCPGIVTCHIHEEFCPGVWDLRATDR